MKDSEKLQTSKTCIEKNVIWVLLNVTRKRRPDNFYLFLTMLLYNILTLNYVILCIEVNVACSWSDRKEQRAHTV